MTDQYLSPTHLREFEAAPIQRLTGDWGWMTYSSEANLAPINSTHQMQEAL